MPTFNSNGVTIHYETFGDGRPIVLIHGVTVSFQTNFQNPNWVEFLTSHGFHVIGIDLRGHGASEKLYTPDAYGCAPMGDDVMRLLDHLALAQVDVMGYSLGGFIALDLALRYPQRWRKVVLGGVGDGALGEGAHADALPKISDALEAADATTITDPVIATYRGFAERIPGNDLRALRAVVHAPFPPQSRAALQRITLPVLIVVGEQDAVVGSAYELAHAIPHAQLVTVPERNHFNVVGDQRYKDAVANFLTTDA